MCIKSIDKEKGFFPPLGLLYIATYLKKHTAHEVRVLDCNTEHIDVPRLETVLLEFQPDIVGVSTITHHLIDAYAAAAVIKKISTDIITVFGGAHASIYPITTVENSNIDYAIRGEGEIVFTELVRAIEQNKSLAEISAIPGIATKYLAKRGLKNGDIQRLFIDDLDSLPSPDRTLVPYKKYHNILSPNRYMTTMFTTRGCPYHCVFCNRMGRKVRSLSPGKVLSEIETLLKLGINEIFFKDDTFTIDQDRVKLICKGIIDRNYAFTWQVRTRADCFDFELLSLMKKAGCSRISFGIESGDPHILKMLRKELDFELARNVVQWCRQLGIQTLANYIIGCPGETKKEIHKTLLFAERLGTDYALFFILSLYPDTDLYRQAMASGLVPGDVWLDFAKNPTRAFIAPIWNENFSREELEEISKNIHKRFFIRPGLILREMKKIESPNEFIKKVRAAWNLWQA
ncbi:MAG: B12-binding domain-containing radical SAM protein [Candidatus Omnitrophica bacterium]|nr:B12-binding domain-containing radical SAM protein [Candidatus Omnitrophota bacterium]